MATWLIPSSRWYSLLWLNEARLKLQRAELRPLPELQRGRGRGWWVVCVVFVDSVQWFLREWQQGEST